MALFTYFIKTSLALCKSMFAHLCPNGIITATNVHGHSDSDYFYWCLFLFLCFSLFVRFHIDIMTVDDPALSYRLVNGSVLTALCQNSVCLVLYCLDDREIVSPICWGRTWQACKELRSHFPSGTFGINWNVDCELDFISQDLCWTSLMLLSLNGNTSLQPGSITCKAWNQKSGGCYDSRLMSIFLK